MITHASMSSYFKNILKDYSYFILLFQQHLPNKKLFPCHWILFLASGARPLGHRYAASHLSAGLWELHVLVMIVYNPITFWAVKFYRNFEENDFIKKPALLDLRVKAGLFSLFLLFVFLNVQLRCPDSCLFYTYQLLLKSFLKCWMEKNLALHDPHCIPGLLLAHLLWNTLMVVALEVEDLFCFFENCIPVPICAMSCALKRIGKGGREKGFKSFVLEVLLKWHWSSTSWLALCQCSSVLGQAG